MEDSAADSNVNYNSPAHEVSEGKDISKCSRDYSGNILAKNVAAFALVLRICLKSN